MVFGANQCVRASSDTPAAREKALWFPSARIPDTAHKILFEICARGCALDLRAECQEFSDCIRNMQLSGASVFGRFGLHRYAQPASAAVAITRSGF